jgi:hypothetical protein
MRTFTVFVFTILLLPWLSSCIWTISHAETDCSLLFNPVTQPVLFARCVGSRVRADRQSEAIEGSFNNDEPQP